MSRINQTQIYAVLWLHSQNWEISKIASELTLSDIQVKNALKKHATTAEGIKTKSSVVSKHPNSKNLMITESQSGKHNVAIMTKAASEINDESKKQHSPKPNCSFTFNHNEK